MVSVFTEGFEVAKKGGSHSSPGTLFTHTNIVYTTRLCLTFGIDFAGRYHIVNQDKMIP